MNDLETARALGGMLAELLLEALGPVSDALEKNAEDDETDAGAEAEDQDQGQGEGDDEEEEGDDEDNEGTESPPMLPSSRFPFMKFNGPVTTEDGEEEETEVQRAAEQADEQLTEDEREVDVPAFEPEEAGGKLGPTLQGKYVRPDQTTGNVNDNDDDDDDDKKEGGNEERDGNEDSTMQREDEEKEEPRDDDTEPYDAQSDVEANCGQDKDPDSGEDSFYVEKEDAQDEERQSDDDGEAKSSRKLPLPGTSAGGGSKKKNGENAGNSDGESYSSTVKGPSANGVREILCSSGGGGGSGRSGGGTVGLQRRAGTMTAAETLAAMKSNDGGNTDAQTEDTTEALTRTKGNRGTTSCTHKNSRTASELTKASKGAKGMVDRDKGMEGKVAATAESPDARVGSKRPRLPSMSTKQPGGKEDPSSWNRKQRRVDNDEEEGEEVQPMDAGAGGGDYEEVKVRPKKSRAASNARSETDSKTGFKRGKACTSSGYSRGTGGKLPRTNMAPTCRKSQGKTDKVPSQPHSRAHSRAFAITSTPIGAPAFSVAATWICPRCTFLNEADALTCALCESGKPSLQDRALRSRKQQPSRPE